MSESPADRPTLSLCMIVRDEARLLGDCLRRARDFVDEIVVVDTGSSDATRSIAAQFTERVYDFNWNDDFAAARNHALAQARGDWIVVLDADEAIEPEGWRSLRERIATTERDAFFLEQRNYGREATAEGWVPVGAATPWTRDYPGYKPNPIARVFRNRPDICYRGRVHEVIDHSLAEGGFEVLDIPIHHYMDDDASKPRRQRQLNYLRIIEQDIDSVDDGRLFLAAGSIRLHHLGDYAGAIGHLEKAIELGYRVDECREFIALARYCLGAIDAAYADYRALYAEGYRTLSLCNNLANLAVRRGENGFAADLLEEGLAMGVADPQMRSRLEHNIRHLRGGGD